LYLLEFLLIVVFHLGKVSIVKASFTKIMNQASQELNFELAQSYKDKIDYLEKFQSKSLIVQPKISNIDIFSILHDEKSSFINFMMVEEGAIKISETVEVKNELSEKAEDVLAHAILDLKAKYKSGNKEILTNILLEDWPEYTIMVPKIGDKRKLLELSLKNALFSKKEKQERLRQRQNNHLEVLEELQERLKLKNLPKHIECFDNSNVQGTNPVASMVCFKDGKASKKDYRKYNIKTVIGPDDFSSMKEVVSRRYAHLQRENLPFPDLILIDGGKGQLNAAVEAIKALGLYGSIPLAGIAKRLEEIYLPGDQIPVLFNKKSQALMLLQRLRDEAHRFAITFHKQKRSKSATQSVLNDIPGIGPISRDKLLSKYKSLNAIKKAPIEELQDLIGKKASSLVLSRLR
ncbi:MAG: excinuclease ABC subunit UvrC, partial [Bacteroidota bacterium]